MRYIVFLSANFKSTELVILFNIFCWSDRNKANRLKD